MTVRAHLPFARGELLGELHASTRVLGASYDERGAWLTLEATPLVIQRLQRRGLELLVE